MGYLRSSTDGVYWRGLWVGKYEWVNCVFEDNYSYRDVETYCDYLPEYFLVGDSYNE